MKNKIAIGDLVLRTEKSKYDDQKVYSSIGMIYGKHKKSDYQYYIVHWLCSFDLQQNALDFRHSTWNYLTEDMGKTMKRDFIAWRKKNKI